MWPPCTPEATGQIQIYFALEVLCNISYFCIPSHYMHGVTAVVCTAAVRHRPCRQHHILYCAVTTPCASPTADSPLLGRTGGAPFPMPVQKQIGGKTVVSYKTSTPIKNAKRSCGSELRIQSHRRQQYTCDTHNIIFVGKLKKINQPIKHKRPNNPE